MKAVLGLVSLLLVLALVGMIGVRQLRVAGRVGSSPAAAGVAAMPQMSGSGTPGQQSVELQKKVADDVAKAMSDAQARRQEADKSVTP